MNRTLFDLRERAAHLDDEHPELEIVAMPDVRAAEQAARTLLNEIDALRVDRTDRPLKAEALEWVSTFLERVERRKLILIRRLTDPDEAERVEEIEETEAYARHVEKRDDYSDPDPDDPGPSGWKRTPLANRPRYSEE